MHNQLSACSVHSMLHFAQSLRLPDYTLLRCHVNGLPAAVVHVLAQQLDGGLSTILFHLRHVQVIHQDHLLLAYGWAIHTLAPFLQPAVNDVLQVAWMRSVTVQTVTL